MKLERIEGIFEKILAESGNDSFQMTEGEQDWLREQMEASGVERAALPQMLRQAIKTHTQKLAEKMLSGFEGQDFAKNRLISAATYAAQNVILEKCELDTGSTKEGFNGKLSGKLYETYADDVELLASRAIADTLKSVQKHLKSGGYYDRIQRSGFERQDSFGDLEATGLEMDSGRGQLADTTGYVRGRNDLGGNRGGGRDESEAFGSFEDDTARLQRPARNLGGADEERTVRDRTRETPTEMAPGTLQGADGKRETLRTSDLHGAVGSEVYRAGSGMADDTRQGVPQGESRGERGQNGAAHSDDTSNIEIGRGENVRLQLTGGDLDYLRTLTDPQAILSYLEEKANKTEPIGVLQSEDEAISSDTLFHLSFREAMKMWHNDIAVYLVNDDGTNALAESREDILRHCEKGEMFADYAVKNEDLDKFNNRKPTHIQGKVGDIYVTDTFKDDITVDEIMYIDGEAYELENNNRSSFDLRVMTSYNGTDESDDYDRIHISYADLIPLLMQDERNKPYFAAFDEGFVPAPRPERPIRFMTLVRVGDFYEIYGEEARKAAEIFNFTVLNRSGAEFVGVPMHKLDDYRKQLEAAGITVSVLENYEHHRTFIDQNHLDIERIIARNDDLNALYNNAVTIYEVDGHFELYNGRYNNAQWLHWCKTDLELETKEITTFQGKIEIKFVQFPKELLEEVTDILLNNRSNVLISREKDTDTRDIEVLLSDKNEDNQRFFNMVDGKNFTPGEADYYTYKLEDDPLDADRLMIWQRISDFQDRANRNITSDDDRYVRIAHPHTDDEKTIATIIRAYIETFTDNKYTYEASEAFFKAVCRLQDPELINIVGSWVMQHDTHKCDRLSELIFSAELSENEKRFAVQQIALDDKISIGELQDKLIEIRCDKIINKINKDYPEREKASIRTWVGGWFKGNRPGSLQDTIDFANCLATDPLYTRDTINQLAHFVINNDGNSVAVFEEYCEKYNLTSPIDKERLIKEIRHGDTLADLIVHATALRIHKEPGEAEAEIVEEAIEPDTRNSQEEMENDLLTHEPGMWGIYQIKDVPELRDYRFANNSDLTRLGLQVKRENYDLVYTQKRQYEISNKTAFLNKIFETLNDNLDPPPAFKGHSASVSDVIVLQWNGEMSAHFIDSAGFIEIPNFLEKAAEVAQEAPTETPPENSRPVVAGEISSRTGALKHFSGNGAELYLVNPDGSEIEAQSIRDILNHSGTFTIKNVKGDRETMIKWANEPIVEMLKVNIAHYDAIYEEDNYKVPLLLEEAYELFINGYDLYTPDGERVENDSCFDNYYDFLNYSLSIDRDKAEEYIRKFLPIVGSETPPENSRPVVTEEFQSKTVLMPLLYEDGMLNRSGKRTHVQTEPPIGKYPIYSLSLGDTPYAYTMTDSGKLISLGGMDVLKNATEYMLDKHFERLQSMFDKAMQDPAEWVDFASAAVVDKIDEADKHNNVVNEFREKEEKAKRAADEAKRLAEEKEKAAAFEARLDDIENKILSGERANVEVENYKEQNPLLALFERHNISISPKTKGWIASKLTDIRTTENGGIETWFYRTGNKAKVSEVYLHALYELKDRIEQNRAILDENNSLETPPENSRPVVAEIPAAEPKPEISPYSPERVLYNQFAELFPDIVSEKYNYVKLEAGESFMPLTVEHLGGDRYAVMHFYTQNGDLMRDPDMEFQLDIENKTLTALTFTQHGSIAIYSEVDETGGGGYRNVNGHEGYVPNLQRELNVFARDWFNNIKQQEYELVKAYDRVTGETVLFDDGKAIEAAHEMTAETPENSELLDSPPQEDYLTEVTKEEALRLYKSGRASVYMLYDDDSEGAVESIDDIEEYDGRFGFEHSYRDTAYIAEIREFLATPEIPSETKDEQPQYIIRGLTFVQSITSDPYEAHLDVPTSLYAVYNETKSEWITDEDGNRVGYNHRADAENHIQRLLNGNTTPIKSSEHQNHFATEKSNAAPAKATYDVGDVIYYKDRDYYIEKLYAETGGRDMVNILPTTGYPVSGVFTVAVLEREMRLDSRNDKYFPDLAEKPLDVETLAVGDIIAIGGKQFEVTEINGDFSISYDNMDKTDIMKGTGHYGHWKQRLIEDGATLVKKAKDRTDLQEAMLNKKATRSPAKKTDNPNQGSLFDITATTGHETEPAPSLSSFSASPAQGEHTETTPATTGRKNYHFPDSRDSWQGDKVRYADNIAAIKTLKLIEEEQREPTAAECDILSKYVGWGGLSNAFNEASLSWNREYKELKELLTEEEYYAARKSTTNAHYTSTTVIDAIYAGLVKMGLTDKSRILEPSCGIGNFIGRLPENIENCRVTGVEIDSITGRIAKALYPEANINVRGFETLNVKNGTYDAVIGNVPFGALKVNDKEYNHLNYNIHDYFIAKAIDKTAPGGVVAVVTSAFTLDKKDTKQRKYFAERAELLGAVRLPHTAFKGNANTEVTSDILFLKKRPYAITIPEAGDGRPNWIDRGYNADGLPVNQYFIDNPEMILGTLVEGNKLYGGAGRDNDKGTQVNPFTDTPLSEQLEKAIGSIDGQFDYALLKNKRDNAPEESRMWEYAPANSRKFSYIIHDNTIYWRGGEETMKPITLTADSKLTNKDITGVQIPAKYAEQLKALVRLAGTYRELLELQSKNVNGGLREAIDEQRGKLNRDYDRFVGKFGRINNPTNQKLIKGDNNGYLLTSLEIYNSKGEYQGKASAFTVDVIKPREIPTYTDNIKDALIICVSEVGKVDIDYICELTKKSDTDVIAELTESGEIYKNPLTKAYETYDEYLSGNIREKLEFAETFAALDPAYRANVEALKQNIPPLIEAKDIYPHLGSNWIPEKYYSEFIRHLLKYNIDGSKPIVNYNETLDTYDIDKPYLYGASLSLNENTYGVYYKDDGDFNKVGNRVLEPRTMTALQIIEGTLNGRILKINKPKQDEDGNVIYREDKDGNPTNNKEMITDPKATAVLQQKQREIREQFKDWIFKDRERRGDLTDIYNRRFNSIKLREFDGSRLTLRGKSEAIELRTHQLDAAAKCLAGNTLLAHEVGAGKSFTMIAAAMEGKRLGLHQKSLFVVPNHLTRQMGNDFLTLYPDANILVADKEDFTKEKRKAFFAKIATGDYDAVIIGHSQFERLSLSKEEQERFMQKEVKKFEKAWREASNDDSPSGKRFAKALEKAKNNFIVNMEKKLVEIPDDDVVDFERLGIDKLFVDESHMFKNLQIKSKFAREIAGIGGADANRATDMYMKCSYLNEKTGGKGVVMSSGTPISNTLSEMYTNMRYLMPENELVKMNLHTFDKWASTFAQVTTGMELKPESDGGYQLKTRFSKFDNLPELMTIFKTFADVKTYEELDLPRPKLIGVDKDDNPVEGKCTDIVAKPSRIQRKYIRELGERAAEIRNGNVAPEKDNMLKITSDGRKIGLDQRIIDPTAPDNPNSKVNLCIKRVTDIYNATAEKKGTQLIFCDMSTPSAAKNGGFCLYNDIKEKLIQNGVKAEEIAFIHDCKTDEQKQALYNRMNEGEIRIMLGSTTMCGAGMNAQQKMVALHDLDCPMRPSDMEQRHGRIQRQGNENAAVEIFRYVSDKTFDAFMYQMLEVKQGFIGQIMTAKKPQRQCDEIDEQQLDFSEVKALCAGNPLIKEKVDLESALASLKISEKSFNDNFYRLQYEAETGIPNKIERTEKAAERLREDKITISRAEKKISAEEKTEYYPITIDGKEYEKFGLASVAITAECLKLGQPGDTAEIGEFCGLKLSVMRNEQFSTFTPPFSAILKGAGEYNVPINIGNSESAKSGGIMRSIFHAVKEIPNRLTETEGNISSLRAELAEIKADLEKPFPEKAALRETSERLEDVNRLLTEADSEMKLPIELYKQLNALVPEVLSGEKHAMQLTTNDGFDVYVVNCGDGSIKLTDSEEVPLEVYCKINPAFDENNNAVYSLVLTGSYVDGRVHDFMTPNASGVKSCPSKKELDFVNDIIDCADCEEFSAVEVEFREVNEIEQDRRTDIER